MYQPSSSDNGSLSSNIADYHHQQQQQQASPVPMGYSAAHSSSTPSPVGSEYNSHHHNYQQESMSSGYQDQSGGLIPPDPYGQSQQHQQAGMYGAPQVNLPLRNRNSMNLMMKQSAYPSAVPSMMGTSPTHMGMHYAGVNGVGGAPSYPSQGVSSMGPPPMYPTNMGYPGDMSSDYNRMAPYGMLPSNGVGYNPMIHQQQQQQQYGINRYPYGGGGMMNGVAPGMPGYEYYQQGYGGGGYDKSQMRNGGKWTSAPPMPSYPPACSKEEKKEKIAKWLKKRENRNWSNKPSYPVRHSIAKNRKRGEDGRFITKARLAQMALEEAAAGGGVGMVVHPEGSNEYDDEVDDYDEHVSMATLPVPTSVP